jgi:membrane associated rhomboid family serine protease
MTFNILLIIILITIGISLQAFNNRGMLERMMYIPYDCKHNRNFKRIFSHMLIHADWAHLLFNMFSLYFLGDFLIKSLIIQYGSIGGQTHFFLIYILGGIFATFIPYIRNQNNPSYRSLGASGAVSAVIFGAIIWSPGMELQMIFIPIPIPGYIFGPLYLLYEFYADKKGGSGIAHDAHIGGAIFGILYVLIINIDKGKEFIEYIF